MLSGNIYAAPAQAPSTIQNNCDVIEGAPGTVENRSKEIRGVHAKLFPRGERPESKPKSGSTLTQTATIPQPAATSTQAAGTKDQIVSEVLGGHLPGTPRSDLAVGIMGALVAKGWERGDIEDIVKVLVAGFHQSDRFHDVEGTITKQLKKLDRLCARKETNKVMPGFKVLEPTLTPEAIPKLRSLVTGDSHGFREASDVAGTLTLIRNQPPESFEHQEIRYLIEPAIPKGAPVTNASVQVPAAVARRFCRNVNTVTSST